MPCVILKYEVTFSSFETLIFIFVTGILSDLRPFFKFSVSVILIVTVCGIIKFSEGKRNYALLVHNMLI